MPPDLQHLRDENIRLLVFITYPAFICILYRPYLYIFCLHFLCNSSFVKHIILTSHYSSFPETFDHYKQYRKTKKLPWEILPLFYTIFISSITLKKIPTFWKLPDACIHRHHIWGLTDPHPGKGINYCSHYKINLFALANALDMQESILPVSFNNSHVHHMFYIDISFSRMTSSFLYNQYCAQRY